MKQLITNEEYNKIADLLPTGKLKDKTLPDNRLFIEAVVYIAKTGCGWRQLPKEYGKWYSVWKRFKRWCIKGVWDNIFERLKSKETEEVAIDSTSIKVHQEGMRYIKKILK